MNTNMTYLALDLARQTCLLLELNLAGLAHSWHTCAVALGLMLHFIVKHKIHKITSQ